jgi:hypothetical protein
MELARSLKIAAVKLRRALLGSSSPRVVMTLLCRNEGDIVAQQVAFQLAMGVDFVIAMDNASDDNTADLLRHFERMGRLRLLHQPARNFDQGAWVTAMARMAKREHDADWVINSDTDEFWWPQSGDFKSTLASLPEKVNIIIAERVNFRPSRSDGRPFYERMLIRELASEKFRGGKLEPKVAHRAYPDVCVKHGNHDASLGDRKRVRAARGTIQILHYPIRTYSQWARRINEGAVILEEHTDHTPWISGGWRHMRDHYVKTGTLREYFDRLALETADLAVAPDKTNLTIDTRIRDVIRANQHLLPETEPPA